MFSIVLKDPAELRMYIAKKGLSLGKFANEIGISQTYLSQILSGDKRPSPTTSQKIAEGVEKNIEDIFLFKVVDKIEH